MSLVENNRYQAKKFKKKAETSLSSAEKLFD